MLNFEQLSLYGANFTNSGITADQYSSLGSIGGSNITNVDVTGLNLANKGTIKTSMFSSTNSPIIAGIDENGNDVYISTTYIDPDDGWTTRTLSSNAASYILSTQLATANKNSWNCHS